MVGIARELARVFEALRPAVVITHPYEGGHPDHDATALAVRAASRLVRGGSAPLLVEMTSYHADLGRPGSQVTAGRFLAGGEDLALWLDGEARVRKRRMLDCYASQKDTLDPFGVDVERFRVAPACDFRRAPHEGALRYERLGWTMTGERFRELARRALADLGLGGEPAI